MGMAKSFLAEAVKIAYYVLNRPPSTMIDLKTLIEMQIGNLVVYSSLHVFGCLVYLLYNFQERTKLDSKSRKCVLQGYANNVKGYLPWDPTARKVVVSKDVVFAENELHSEHKNEKTFKETVIVLMDEKSKENDSFEAELEHDEHEQLSTMVLSVDQRVRRRNHFDNQTM